MSEILTDVFVLMILKSTPTETLQKILMNKYNTFQKIYLVDTKIKKKGFKIFYFT